MNYQNELFKLAKNGEVLLLILDENKINGLTRTVLTKRFDFSYSQLFGCYIALIEGLDFSIDEYYRVLKEAIFSTLNENLGDHDEVE